jgi:pentose-5-phosphate-3-epimerase
LSKLKYVLVMSVEPGFGGQEFVEAAMEDVQELVRLRNERGYNYKIGVDGGVEKEHLEMLEKAGVDEVAVGARRVVSWE